MRRYWVLLGLASVCLLGLVSVCFLGLASFSQEALNLDAKALLEASKARDVRILRDTWGVPHIFGKTDADVAFGLAYAHCEDDFATIQEAGLSGLGKLASVKGKEAAPIDYMAQLFRVWETGEKKYETDLSPETRAICDAYAEGANLYAALHPDEVLRNDLFPVTGKLIPANSALVTPFFYCLDDELKALFDEERKKPVPEKTVTLSKSGNPGVALAKYLGKDDAEIGSNVVAVGPSRSADGATRLLINPHMPWTGPIAWYEAHLVSKEGLDIVGGVLPGSPVIVMGHNRNLGWGHTINRPDLADIYVLEMNPDNPNQYKFDGEWRDLEVRTIKI
jgi:penicillin amidase/acyl-homoserine-lactone acylase